MPLFVRAGSIVPIGEAVESTHQKQASPGFESTRAQTPVSRSSDDDGSTYAYEKGAGDVTHLKWNDGSHQLTHEGPAAWSGPDDTVVKIF